MAMVDKKIKAIDINPDYKFTKAEKNAQQMLEICRANESTMLEVEKSIELLLNYIKQTKI